MSIHPGASTFPHDRTFDSPGGEVENGGMPYVEQTEDRISPAERAVCYYTLPRAATPVSAGVLAVYGVLLAEAAAVLCYGAAADNDGWVRAGAWALGILAVGGLAWSFLIALAKDVRRRRLLAAARCRTEAPDSGELPDPFAGHALLKRPLRPSGALFACSDNEGLIHCFVDVRSPRTFWRVTSSLDEPLFDLMSLQGPRSFFLTPWSGAQPGRIGLFLSNEKRCEIRQGFGWRGPVTHVLPRGDGEPYVVRQGGVFHRDRLVGRIYALRRTLYLDIEREHLSEGVLGTFISAR